ncbi:MAG: hypothetical protein V9E94_15875 [Microthrixaceae bacterium]
MSNIGIDSVTNTAVAAIALRQGWWVTQWAQRTQPLCCPSLDGRGAAVRPGQHAVAGEPEQRGQQRDRDEHGHGHDDRGRVAQRRDEGDPGQLEAEDGDHHRATGHHHGLARGGVRPADRLLDVHALGQLVPVPAQDEQRVVDADPEPDHGAEPRGDRRDGDPRTEQPHDRESRHEPGDRDAERHHSREHRPERHEQDDERSDDADHLGRTGGAFLQHGRQLPAELHLDIGPVGRAGGVEQQIERGPTELGGRRVELHRSERRRAVG